MIALKQKNAKFILLEAWIDLLPLWCLRYQKVQMNLWCIIMPLELCEDVILCKMVR